MERKCDYCGTKRSVKYVVPNTKITYCNVCAVSKPNIFASLLMCKTRKVAS